MFKFYRKPNQSSYAGQLPGALSVILDGPASRYSKNVTRNTRLVNCQWTFDSVGYQYARSFFRTATKKGALPFLIDLILDGSTPTEYTAFFVPGSWSLSSISTETFVIGATLEVRAP